MAAPEHVKGNVRSVRRQSSWHLRMSRSPENFQLTENLTDPMHAFHGMRFMENIDNKVTPGDFRTKCVGLNQNQLLDLIEELYDSMFSLHSLMKTAVSLNKDTHKTHSLRRIVEETHRIVSCHNVTLYLVSNDKEFLSVAWTDDEAVDKNAEIPMGKGIVGMVADKGRSVRVTQEKVSMKTCPEYRDVRANSKLNIIATPIYDNNRRVIAVLTANERSFNREELRQDGFTDEDRSMMRFIGALAGYTIQNILLYAEMNRKQQESETLQKMMEKMSNDLVVSRRAVISDMIESTYKLINVERISYFSVDHVTDELVCEVSPDAKGLRLPIGKGIVGYVALHGIPQLVNDVNNDMRWTDCVDMNTDLDTKNILSVPVKDHDGVCLGVIQAVNKISQRSRLRLDVEITTEGKRITDFEQSDERLLMTVSKSVNMILKKARQLEELRILARKNEALVGVLRAKNSALVGVSNPTNVWENIVDLTYEILECHRISVFTIDESKKTCHINISRDLSSDITIPYGTGVVGYVAEHGETVRLDDAYSDPRFSGDVDKISNYETHSLMAVAITDARNRRVGVIEAINKLSGKFTDTDESVLETIAMEIGETLRAFQSEMVLEQYMYEHGDLADWLQQFMPDSNASESSRTRKAFRSAPGSEAGEFFGARSLLVRPQAKLPSQHLLKTLATTDFDSLFYEPEQLNQLALSMFLETGLVEDLNVPQDRLWNFICSVAASYKPNPFHNWSHGFHVLQFTYFCIMNTGITSHLRKIEVFALLIAAMCHDVDHPGNNNDFEILTETNRAFLYNDISVLENHHAHSTFVLLRDPNNDIFSDFTRAEQREIRRLIVNAILATDMKHHSEIVEFLRARDPAKIIDKTKSHERQHLANFIVHLSDLSAQCYPWDIAKQWETRILREMYNQTQMEIERNLPPFMQDIDKPARRFTSQVGFIDCVLKQFWLSASDAVPELQFMYDQLMKNRDSYKDIADNWEEREFEPLILPELRDIDNLTALTAISPANISQPETKWSVKQN